MDIRLLPLPESIRIIIVLVTSFFHIVIKKKSIQNFAIKEHKKLRLFADSVYLANIFSI